MDTIKLYTKPTNQYGRCRFNANIIVQLIQDNNTTTTEEFGYRQYESHKIYACYTDVKNLFNKNSMLQVNPKISHILFQKICSYMSHDEINDGIYQMITYLIQTKEPDMRIANSKWIRINLYGFGNINITWDSYGQKILFDVKDYINRKMQCVRYYFYQNYDLQNDAINIYALDNPMQKKLIQDLIHIFSTPYTNDDEYNMLINVMLAKYNDFIKTGSLSVHFKDDNTCRVSIDSINYKHTTEFTNVNKTLITGYLRNMQGYLTNSNYWVMTSCDISNCYKQVIDEISVICSSAIASSRTCQLN